MAVGLAVFGNAPAGSRQRVVEDFEVLRQVAEVLREEFAAQAQEHHQEVEKGLSWLLDVIAFCRSNLGVFHEGGAIFYFFRF